MKYWAQCLKTIFSVAHERMLQTWDVINETGAWTEGATAKIAVELPRS